MPYLISEGLRVTPLISEGFNLLFPLPEVKNDFELYLENLPKSPFIFSEMQNHDALNKLTQMDTKYILEVAKKTTSDIRQHLFFNASEDVAKEILTQFAWEAPEIISFNISVLENDYAHTKEKKDRLKLAFEYLQENEPFIFLNAYGRSNTNGPNEKAIFSNDFLNYDLSLRWIEKMETLYTEQLNQNPKNKIEYSNYMSYFRFIEQFGNREWAMRKELPIEKQEELTEFNVPLFLLKKINESPLLKNLLNVEKDFRREQIHKIFTKLYESFTKKQSKDYPLHEAEKYYFENSKKLSIYEIAEMKYPENFQLKMKLANNELILTKRESENNDLLKQFALNGGSLLNLGEKKDIYKVCIFLDFKNKNDKFKELFSNYLSFPNKKEDDEVKLIKVQKNNESDPENIKILKLFANQLKKL